MLNKKIKLIIDNVYTSILNAPQDVELKIWNELSFEVQEYETKFVHFRHLFNRKTKKTYTGLLDYVLVILDNLGEDYEITDNRIKHIPNADFKLVEYVNIDGKQIKLEARPYQKDILDRCDEREVIQAATGAGKTFLMAGIIAKFNVKPVAVFADKLTLCNQLKDEFEKFLGIKVGFVGDGINEKEDITVYTMQSTTAEDVSDAKMILFDECFDYDTSVLMEDYTYCKIGDLFNNHTSKKIISYNHLKNEYENKKIIGYYQTHLKESGKKLIKLYFQHQEKGRWDEEIITCTDDHKFWIENKQQYIEAKQIELGDKFLVSDIHVAEVIFKKMEYIDTSSEEYDEYYVYDIEIEDNHNFFVSDILVHNCHHIPSNTMLDIAKNCKDAYYRIGVSATPWRDAGDDLLIEAVLKKRNPDYAINASKLIKLGFLVPATIYLVPMKTVFPGKNYNKVYEEAIVNNKDRNMAILKIAKKMHEKGKSILILVQRVEHGEMLAEKLRKYVGDETTTVNVEDKKNNCSTLIRVKSVEFLSGKDGQLKRKAVLEAVKQKKCKILIGSVIADEGLDLPTLDCLILGGGGKSSTRAFQRIGRVLRTALNKERALVFDFIDYTPMLKRHSQVRHKLYKTEPEWEIKLFDPDLLK